MRTLPIILIATLGLLSCGTSSRYRYQEPIKTYTSTGYSSTGTTLKDWGQEAVPEQDSLITEPVNPKQELIRSLEQRGLKPCRLVERVLNKKICREDTAAAATTVEEPQKAQPEEPLKKRQLFKNKEARHWFWQGVFKIAGSIYFAVLAITNFQLFTMVFPTSICLLACICYPIWWKRGYLDTPYAKIATFIAAYGGLFANILWIILYI